MLWSCEWLLTARCLGTNNSCANIRPEPRSTAGGFYIEQTALSTLKANPIDQAGLTPQKGQDFEPGPNQLSLYNGLVIDLKDSNGAYFRTHIEIRIYE